MARRRSLAALLWFLAGLGPAAAQRYAHLSGSILDPSEAAVPGADVSVVNEDTGFRRSARSASNGTYAVSSLEPGIYKITVRKDGFRTIIRFGVRIELSRSARIDFALSVGSIEETITVEGTAPLLNTDDASPGATVRRDAIERLPANGHGLLGLLDLAPGTLVTPATRGESGQFTVNGQRPNSHTFTVDGVSANTGVSGGGLPVQPTGGALPAMSAFGSLHSLVSLEALEEFHLQPATATPESGRLPGATVTLNSRSGSNDFHGSLAYSFRHELLDANDWFANRAGDRRAPLRMSDVGAALGGPLRRDRTFFFFAYEGMRLRQPFAWRAPVPSTEVKQAAPAWVLPLLDFFPAPNGPVLAPGVAEWDGRNHRPSRLDTASLRVDHAWSPRATVFARYNVSPSASEFGSTQVNRLDLRWRSFTSGLNLRPSPSVVVDLRMNASSARADSTWLQTGGAPYDPCQLEPVTAYLLRIPGICDYLVRLSIAGVGQATSGREGRRAQGQFQTVGTTALTLGAHSLRVGADYRRLSPSRRDATGALSIIAESLSDLIAGRNLWTASSGPQDTGTVLHELSLFAQDSWRISPRLTASYGLRWEYNPAPVSRPPSYYLLPPNSLVTLLERPLWPAAYRNFAPRAGLAWRLSPAGRTVLRAAAGLYYDSSLSIGTDLLNGGPFSLSAYNNPKYAPFSMLLSYGFMPDLRLPVVEQWTAAVEHAIDGRQTVSAGYVGSAGRRLVRREMGGPGNSDVLWISLATNHGKADYHGLQLQYRRVLARGFQGFLSYTWSHSIDDSSSDSGLYWAGAGSTNARDRGSSDFDARHVLSAAFGYQLPPRQGLARAIGGWALDGILRARTGFPVTVQSAEHYLGMAFVNAFRPDLVPGQVVWTGDPDVPGGRRLNPAAFRPAADGVQGGLGRNALSGPGMSQFDMALRRDFPVGGDRSLELRLEAFNALNHPNFADPVKFLDSPLFGQPASMLNLMMGSGSPASGLAPMFQTGGARSLQLTLRLRF